MVLGNTERAAERANVIAASVRLGGKLKSAD